MHFIDPKTIPADKWIRNQHGFCPDAIKTKCPYCSQQVFLRVVVTVNQSFIPEIQSLGLKGICPSCDREKSIQVFFIEISKEQENPYCKEIWINPDPKVRSLIIDELPNKVVFNSYKLAIEAFNNGMWSLAVFACERSVERIWKTTFSKSEFPTDMGGLLGKLRSELEQTPDFKEFLAPFLNAGEALRVGRDPDELFELEVEPDRNLAERVLDLTEFLIKSAYLIAGETSEVSRLMSELQEKEQSPFSF